jgi:hypothetical protein
MIIGCGGGGLTVILSSFFIDFAYANLVAVLYIFAQLFMAFLDIACHAVMVK